MIDLYVVNGEISSNDAIEYNALFNTLNVY